MTTVKFQTTPNGEVAIAAWRSDVKETPQGLVLIDILKTVKLAIDEFIDEIVEKGGDVLVVM